jgi:hypothetical protein
MIRTAAVCILVSVCSAAGAAAQSAFVQGGAGLDIRRFSAEEGQAVFDGSISAVTLGVGGFVTPRMTIGVELDFGGTTTETRSVTVPIGGVPTTVASSFALERRSVTALAGVHTSGAYRVRLGGYAGVAFSTVRREIATDVVGLPLPPPEPSILIDRLAGPVVGVDVAVTVVPHVALVGALRAQGLALTGEVTGFSIRPAGFLRVTF